MLYFFCNDLLNPISNAICTSTNIPVAINPNVMIVLRMAI